MLSKFRKGAFSTVNNLVRHIRRQTTLPPRRLRRLASRAFGARPPHSKILATPLPAGVAPVFFGGRLLALCKKSGGVRPIAIGFFSLRRLASKCANQCGPNRLKSYFHPHQVGVGIHGGCEAAIHSDRRFLESCRLIT